MLFAPVENVQWVNQLYGAVQSGDEWRKDMKQAFNELVLLVRDEHTVSAYELCTSGLVQALYSTLSVSVTSHLVAVW